MGRWKMPALGLAALAGIQTVRMGLVFLAQLVGPDSLTWNRVYSAAFFLAASAALVWAMRRAGIRPAVLPPSRKPGYTAAAALTALFWGITPFITRDFSAENLVFLAESALLLPVFEELLFRGFLWDRLERAFGGGSAALWLSAALFGLWHVGYADTILCRMAWTGREGNLIAILCGKVLTGFLLGLCFGWLRRKFRNGFPGLLAHIVLNTMG